MCSSPFFSQRLVILALGLLLAGCNSGAEDPRAAFENQQYELARDLWLPRAEAGDPAAQNAIGTIYYLGLGVGRNDDKALQWFEKAARQGHPGAQRNAGMMYLDGRGADQDYLTAYMWFYAADKQGNDSADMYINTLVNKLTPTQQIKARRTADQFIINPTADYVPAPEMPKANPQVEDFRESS